ncbi:transcriptional antiterminator [Paenibacillus shirakamiensis]|uniref:Transcriptional antiterminator n=1 Tax=Paenibacillus shirakamiensis TaxID=1265935 RepID=A0ABS4JGZ5_9BACL|nr:PRD domain-containing protein [Paenibacillus shirakamiensis]MBP2000990.1 transcriptional antiterminator [Paenibacillus shirakamiensis]
MSEKELLQVQRVIGNNVVMAQGGKNGTEYVLLGKGIGFAVKGAGVIEADDPRIEKRFRLEDREQWSQYERLMEDFDPKVMNITDQIIHYISESFPEKLNDKVYLALPSHIQFTVYRLRNGMDIINPFLQETKLCFPKEYEIASRAAEMISEAFHIHVPEDEVGFLTYHVYSAVSNVPVGQLVKASNLVNNLLEIIQKEKNIKFQQGSMSHVRLMLHLRYSLERLLQNTRIDNPFVNHIRFEYREEYLLASRLGKVMEEELGKKVPEEEICYIAMHLYRLYRTNI